MMNKIIRTFVIASALLAGLAGTSYAQLMNNAPQPLPPGVQRG
jgi:CHASE3 domain sensor protein